MTRRLLAAFLLLLAALAGGAAFLLATEEGLRWGLRHLGPFLPGGISATEVSGRLIGPLELRGVRLHGPGYRARIERVRLDWQPAALLEGTLDLDYLRAEGLRYTRIPGPSPGEDEPASLRPEEWAPPIAVRIRELRLEGARFRLEPAGTAYRLARLSARLGINGERLFVRELEAEGPALEGSGELRMALAGGQEVTGSLAWTLRPREGPVLHGRTSIEGSLRERLELRQHVTGPLTLTADGTLREPMEDLRWQVAVRVKDPAEETRIHRLFGPDAALRIEAAGDAEGGDGELRFQGSRNDLGPLEGRADFRIGFAEPFLAIPSLSLRANKLGTAVSARGRVVGPMDSPSWRLSGELTDVNLARLESGLPMVHGGLRLEASGDLVTAEGRLAVRGQEPQAGPFHAETAFRADWAESAISLRGLEVRAQRLPDAVVSGGGKLALEGSRWRADLEGNWKGLRWPPQGPSTLASPDGSWSLSGTPEELRAELQGALRPGGGFQARARYRGETVEGQVHWTGIRLPGTEPGLRLEQGRLQVSGEASDYRLDLRTTLSYGAEREALVEGHARGDTRHLEWQRLRAELLGGSVQGRGRLAWGEVPEASVDLRAHGLDPGRWFPAWPGDLGGRLRASAAIDAEGPRIDVPEVTLEGTLRQRPLQARARGGYTGDRVRVEELEVTSGQSRVSASGTLGESVRVAWGIRSPDLGELYPGLGGRLEGHGEVTGSLRSPDLTARLSGSGLAWEGNRVEGLELEVALRPDGSGDPVSRLQLDLTGVEAGGMSVARLEVSGSGSLADHRLLAGAESDLGQARMVVGGEWQSEAGAWRFRLRQARVEPAAYPGAWELQDPATGEIAAARVTLGEACLASGDGRVCASGGLEGGAARLAFRARSLPLGYLEPLLPPGTGIQGLVRGEGELMRTSEGRITGRAELHTTEGRLTALDGTLPRAPQGKAEGDKGIGGDGSGEETGDGAVTIQAFRPSHVTVTADGENIRAEGLLELDGGDSLRADLRLAQGPGPWSGSALSGRLQGRLTDLQVITAFVPEISELSAQLQADLRLGGTLARPDWGGELRLEGQRLTLVSPGITLTDLRASVEPTPQGDLRLQAQATSDGTLRVEGTLRFQGDERRLEATVRGEGFQILATPQARAWTSPELEVRVAGDLVEITGQVRIPKAEITLKRLPGKGVVRVSRDQVIVRPGQEEAVAAQAWRFRSEVRIILGNKVHFQGFGLSSRISGEVTIREEPGQPTTAQGELRAVEGQYTAYGQELKIETGKLIFGGGTLTNPGLDVRATRQPRTDITVGVQVQGRLKDPRISLFSEPPMDETDQLSWLVLGRPMEQNSEGEQASLSRVAMMLGISGSEGLAQKLGTDLGLDKVAVENRPTETGQEASVVLGKYLSPGLFVSYGIGLFEAVNTVRVRYTLSEHWEVVTESSVEQTGGDIFWTTESGR